MKRSVPMFGVISLITVMAVLCLCTLTLLAIVTVQADERLSKRNAKYVESYYEAEQEAHKIIADLRTHTIPFSVSKDRDIFSFSCKILGKQELQVKVRVNASTYEILEWQETPCTLWSADETITVWEGE